MDFWNLIHLFIYLLFLIFKKKYGASIRSGKTAANEERRVPITIVVFGA